MHIREVNPDLRCETTAIGVHHLFARQG
jgi:hypothetical protein